MVRSMIVVSYLMWGAQELYLLATFLALSSGFRNALRNGIYQLS